MPLDAILKILDPSDLDDEPDEMDDEVVLLPKFCEMVPGLSEGQGAEILIGAYNLLNTNAEVSLSDAIIKIQDISKRQLMMQISFEQMIYMTELIFSRQKEILQQIRDGSTEPA